MGAYDGLSQLSSNGLVETAKKLGYSEENILILEGKEEELKQRFPEVWKNILSCSRQMDKRAPMKYAQDVVATWVFEDALIDALKKNGLPIFHNGCDKNRTILSNLSITPNSDAKIIIGEKMFPLEIMCDYSLTWTKYKKIDLRNNKMLNLQRNNSLFIGVSVLNKKVILLDFSNNIKSTYIEKHSFYGNKPVYSIDISNESFFDFKISLLVKELQKICNKKCLYLP